MSRNIKYFKRNAMERINFDNYLESKKVKKAGPNSRRAYFVELTANLLDEPFKKILGLTADWPVEWIQSMYQLCIDAPNPRRLWFGLRKKRINESKIQR